MLKLSVCGDAHSSSDGLILVFLMGCCHFVGLSVATRHLLLLTWMCKALVKWVWECALPMWCALAAQPVVELGCCDIGSVSLLNNKTLFPSKNPLPKLYQCCCVEEGVCSSALCHPLPLEVKLFRKPCLVVLCVRWESRKPVQMGILSHGEAEWFTVEISGEETDEWQRSCSWTH